VFFIGKHFAEKEMQTNLINNITTVKQIAELASLEVNGTQEITLTNEQKNNDIFSAISNTLFQNTLQVRVPYTAKYGVNLNGMLVEVKSTDSLVHIYLPQAQLLSYELHLQQMQTQSKAGWLVTENYAFLQKTQGMLYTKSKTELSKNQQHILAAQQNIATTLTNYFKPFNLKVAIHFQPVQNTLHD
jgi:hypothetical protein